MNNLIFIVEVFNSFFKRSENFYFIIFVEFFKFVCLFVIVVDDCDIYSVIVFVCKSLNLF